MSANHDSRMATGVPLRADNWPNFMRYLGERGYRLSFWAQVDFPSIVPNWYCGLEGANGFRKATRVQDVQDWLPAGVSTLYREALAFEKELAKNEMAAGAEKEAIDNGTTKEILDGAGGTLGHER